MRLYIIIFINFLFTLQLSGSGPSHDFIFKKLNTRSGLSSDYVTDILQDSEGFIWLTTDDGINRFDGYDVITFKPAFGSANSFNTMKFKCVEEDMDGNLWFGSYNMGINIFNKITKEVQILDQYGPEGNKLLNNSINDIFRDSKGNIWIGTTRGLNMFNRETGLIETFSEEFFPGKTIPAGTITKIFQNSRDEIMIGSFSNGVYIYNEKLGEFSQILFCESGTDFRKNRIYDIMEDSRGDFWIGTWDAGLYHIRISKDHTYEVLKIIDQKYTRENSQILSSQIIFTIYEDDNGNIWAGTPYGLNIISNAHSPDPVISIYRAGDGDSQVSHNEIYKIFNDRSGVIWLTTRGGGINLIDPFIKRFKSYSIPPINVFNETNTVRSFIHFNDTVLLIGVNGLGFGQYMPDKNKFVPYTRMQEFRNLPGDLNAAVRFHVDSHKNLWIGTRYNGVFVVNPLSGEYYQFLQTTAINAIFEDRYNNVWVGNENGLFQFIPSNDFSEFKEYTHCLEENISSARNSNFVHTIFEDSEGFIWIGTASSGLYRFYNDGTNFITAIRHYEFEIEKPDGLKCNFINTIFEDRNRRLWIGTATAGLAWFNRNNKSFLHVREEDGLSSDNVLDIAGNGDDLWLTTNKGITRFSFRGVNNSQFENYSIDDGLQGNVFIKGAIYTDRSNQIYVGGYNGFNIFNPDNLTRNEYIPSPAITGIRISGREINPYDIIKHGIKLNHNQNNISIEFSALSFIQPNKNKYSYILDGFDDSWHRVNYDRRLASYTNLPAGVYTFKVVASNSSWLWTNEPLSFTFRIKTHPAKSWWAILAYSIVIVSVLTTLYLFRIRNIKIEQALEIQRVERDKEEKINNFKFRFFTNISHELLTPLSVISAGMEDLVKKNSISRENIKVMQRNSSQLMHLLSQLLDFRKIESQKMKVMVSRGDINYFLRNISDNLLPLKEKKSIEIQLNGKVSKIIFFDHDKIEKVITNLLINAIRYTPDNGKIFINYAVTDEEGTDWLSIEVIDSGKGIEPELLKSIFELFYQVKSVTGKSFGAGIGLALSKNLTEIHKGSIYVENDTQYGANFTIKIPVSENSYASDEIYEEELIYQSRNYLINPGVSQMPDSNGIVTNGDCHQKSKEIILVVEDNADFRQLIINYLSDYFTIIGAEDGVEGFRMCLEHRPDMVITDLMMPRMNGLELCSKIKNTFETSHIIVIMLTAKVDGKTRFESYNADANSYIPKPFEIKTLHMRVNSLLKQRRQAFERFNSGIIPQPISNEMSELDKCFLKKIQSLIESNLSNSELNVAALCRELSISNSLLYRKVTNLTGMSPVEFIRFIRLQNAAKHLLEGGVNVSEAAYSNGFNDLSYFSQCFKKQFGVSPKHYSKKVKLN